MPELAEVEYFRRQWDPGLGRRVVRVALHPEKRVYRGTDVAALEKALTGVRLLGSEGRGKQMLFRFARGASIGIHLGMSGRLSVEAASGWGESGRGGGGGQGGRATGQLLGTVAS